MKFFELAIILVLCLITLVKAADLISDSFEYLARRLKIGEFFLGFVILGIISTLPEIAIAINSRNEIPELSLGNIIGGSIITLSLLAGIAIVRFKKFDLHDKFNSNYMVSALFMIVLGVLVLIDQRLDFHEGLIILAYFVLYVVNIYFNFEHEENAEMIPIEMSTKKLLEFFAKAIVGLVLLIASANLTIDTVIDIGKVAGISETVIGLLVLSFGTNLSEVAILLRVKNNTGEKLAFGSIVGSAFMIMSVLGLLTVITGGFVVASFTRIVPGLVLLTVIALELIQFSYNDQKLTLKEGQILIGAFFVFLFTEILITMFSL